MDPTEFDVHVHQNLHRIRMWCKEHQVEAISQIHWDQLWTDVKKGMNWDRMPPNLQTTVEQAMGQAKQRLEAVGELFPAGWNINPVHVPR